MPELRYKQQNNESASERLFLVLAEQLKQPLLQIARDAELGRITGRSEDLLGSIELTADTALKLLDNYLLSTRLAKLKESIELEPVSIAAVLNDTLHNLDNIAKQYRCDLELHLSGKYEPILANKAGLEAALISLGFVFIEAQGSIPHEHRPVLKVAAHRSRSGIVAGMFADVEGLSAEMYRRARQLYGRSHQPLAQLSSASGAGVFVADSLLSSMSTELRIAHHQKLSGLAATFIPSKQMSLV